MDFVLAYKSFSILQIMPPQVCNRCPMVGKRAPELATGAVVEALDKICERTISDVLCSHRPGGPELKAEDHSLLMVDWETARLQLVTGLCEKCDYWQRLPWLLCGMAHWQAHKRQACAQKVIEAMQRDRRPHMHHRRTVPWLDGKLHGDIQKLAVGAAFDSLSPVFKSEVAALFFIPNDETCIEEKHAKTAVAHKKVAHLFC